MWGARNNWQCDSVIPNSCDCYCAQTDVYGNCTSVKCLKDYWPFTKDSAPIKYESLDRDYGTVRKTAHVYIPYNYSTSIASHISDNNVVFQGAEVNSKMSWKIEPRENDKLSKFNFATVTPKNTQVQMVEFLYHPDNQNVEG